MKQGFRFLTSARTLTAIATVLLALGLSGCVHRIAIQQGNFLDKEDVDRVAVGMTRVQVRALLGTPMVADPFHHSRWDYLFYFKMGRWENPRTQHFVVYFDGEDKVERIERLGEAKPEVATANLEPPPEAPEREPSVRDPTSAN
jgi:outer membrane protein assembly factor BamE